jgi:hypothetical protein
MAGDNSKISADEKPVTAKQLKEAARLANGQAFRVNDLVVSTLANLLERVEQLEADQSQRAIKVR